MKKIVMESRENSEIYKSQAPIICILLGDLKGSLDESFSLNWGRVSMDNTLVFIDDGFLSKLSKHLGNGKLTEKEVANEK